MMLMSTLQREVEALSAELTRLRLMVHHIQDVKRAESQQKSCAVCERHNSNVYGGAVAKKKPVSLSEVVSPELTQLLENLLASNRDIAQALSALQKGQSVCGECGSVKQNDQLGIISLKKKKRNKSHNYKKREVVADLSFSVLPEESLGSCKQKSNEGIKNGGHVAVAATTPFALSLSSLPALQTKNTLNNKNLCHAESVEKLHPQQHDALYTEKRPDTARVFLPLAPAGIKMPVESDDFASATDISNSRITAGVINHKPPASPHFEKFSKTCESTDNKEVKKIILGVDSIADSSKEKNLDTSFSTDENGYPLVTSCVLSRRDEGFSPAKTVATESITDLVTPGMNGKGGAQPRFVSRSTTYGTPTPRRGLLERFQENGSSSSVTDV